jgi:TrmH family RNA methyltransferase
VTRPSAPAPRWTRAAGTRLSRAAEGRDGAFLVEGWKRVADALARDDVPVLEAWVADDAAPAEADDLARGAARRRVPFGVAPRRELDRACGTTTPQGAAALVPDVARPAAEVVAAARGTLVLLDRVQDPGNVGAVFRAAAALGAGGVLVGEGTSDPLRAKALRASAGTALALPFARGPLPALLAALSGASVPVWLLDPEGADLWTLSSRPPRVALALGSEGAGPSQALAAAASARLSIPMAAGVESLNVAVSAGIALAHLSRLPVAGRAPVPAPRGRGR